MVDLLKTGLFLAQMKINQWKSEDELLSLQEEKLRALLAHAKEHVPHYRKTLVDTPLRGLDALHQLPVLTKQEIRDNRRSFISDRWPLRSLRPIHTSGSSGIQVTVYHTPAESAYRLALEYHPITEAGVGPFDLQVHLTHWKAAPLPIQRLGIFMRRNVSLYADFENNLRKLSSLRAQVLHSYPSVLAPLARLNNERNAGLKFRTAFCYAEVLSGEARRLITRSFDCDLRNMYGAAEAAWMAWQCEKGNLHVHSDSVIMEILDEQGNPVKKGRTGNIVLTPLWKLAMPLIRYRVGDRGALGSGCACGRGLQVLKSLEGREEDLIVLPSGRVRSANAINRMSDLSGMLAYQIVQEKPDLFVFRYVPARGGFRPASMREVAHRIHRGCLNEDVQVEFESVDSLERGARGKMNVVVSKVKSDAGMRLGLEGDCDG